MTETTHRLVVVAPTATIATLTKQLADEDDLLETLTGCASRDDPFLTQSGMHSDRGGPHVLTLFFVEDGQCGEMAELRIAAQRLSEQLLCMVTHHWHEPLSSGGGEVIFLSGALVIEFDSAEEERTCQLCHTVVGSLSDMAAPFICCSCFPHKPWTWLTEGCWDDPARAQSVVPDPVGTPTACPC